MLGIAASALLFAMMCLTFADVVARYLFNRPIRGGFEITELTLLVLIQLVFVCMVYGPIAAYLVEAFPAKIRYTSFSLPYHIGNGIFGGLVPLVGLSVCAATGNIYAGLWYPMVVAAMTFVVGSILLKETVNVKIWTEISGKKS